MPNTDPAAAPSRLSPRDAAVGARYAKRQDDYDRARQLRRRKEALARLAVIAIWGGLLVWLFRAGTN